MARWGDRRTKEVMQVIPKGLGGGTVLKKSRVLLRDNKLKRVLAAQNFFRRKKIITLIYKNSILAGKKNEDFT